MGGTYDRARLRIDWNSLSNGRFGAASILDHRWGSAASGMSGPKGLFRATQIWAPFYGYRAQGVSESIKARAKTSDARRRTFAIFVGRAARWFFGPGRNALRLPIMGDVDFGLFSARWILGVPGADRNDS